MNASKVAIVVISLDAVQYFLCIVKQIDGIHKNKNPQKYSGVKCIE